MFSVPFGSMIKHPSNQIRTNLIYRGGKSSLTDWMIPYFPPHRTFVDVFGGGGGITFAKSPSEVDIYNDYGNVAKFMGIIQKFGDDVYKRLFFSVYSREYFQECCDTVDKAFEEAKSTGLKEDWVNWAVKWYVSLSQSFRHEEDDNSWLPAKGINAAKVYASHVDDFPAIIDRLRSIIVENQDFRDILKKYDHQDTLFVLDPPYLPSTWEADKGGYRNAMFTSEHEIMLDMAIKCKAQVIICGYPSVLYDAKLEGWKRVTKTREGGIKNSKQKATNRTEVLWIKEHHAGLFFQPDQQEERESQTSLPRLHITRNFLQKFIGTGERKPLR